MALGHHNGIMVELSELSKSYGTVRAIDYLDLSIRQGEFLTLLGPSGCGKTTTLMAVAGFEEPDTGTVRIDGTDMAGVPAYRRPVNTVFQNYSLFPHMTVFDNVAFGLRMERPRPARREISRRVGAMLELVGLDRHGGRLPRQLSGGQQQRVALARALVKEPVVLLLDEPLGALDLKLRKEMQLELKRLQRELGTTFIYVTHDQDEAFTMSDRIAIMNEGRLEQVGTPREIYRRPASPFVAEFLGETNIVPVRILGVEKSAGKKFIRGKVFGAAVNIPVQRGGAPVSGPSEAEASLRPESFRVTLGAAPGRPGGGGHRETAAAAGEVAGTRVGMAGGGTSSGGTAGGASITGTVTDVVFAGATMKIWVQVDGEPQRRLQASVPAGGAAGRLPAVPGTPAVLSFSGEDVVLLGSSRKELYR